jgi:hypothetical protein
MVEMLDGKWDSTVNSSAPISEKISPSSEIWSGTVRDSSLLSTRGESQAISSWEMKVALVRPSPGNRHFIMPGASGAKFSPRISRGTGCDACAERGCTLSSVGPVMMS